MEMPQEIQQYEMSDLRMNKMVRPQVLPLVLRPLLVEAQAVQGHPPLNQCKEILTTVASMIKHWLLLKKATKNWRKT